MIPLPLNDGTTTPAVPVGRFSHADEVCELDGFEAVAVAGDASAGVRPKGRGA